MNEFLNSSNRQLTNRTGKNQLFQDKTSRYKTNLKK